MDSMKKKGRESVESIVDIYIYYIDWSERKNRAGQLIAIFINRELKVYVREMHIGDENIDIGRRTSLTVKN